MKDTAEKKQEPYAKIYNYSLQYIPNKWLSRFGLSKLTRYRIIYFLTVYGFSIAVSFLAFFPAFVLRRVDSDLSYYLVFSVAVSLAAWYGGIRAGVLTIVVTTIEAYYFFSISAEKVKPLSLFLTPATVFIISGGVTSFLIDLARRNGEVKQLKRREQIYAETFARLHKDFENAVTEIKARDEFLSIASHELKTPLTSMLLKLHDMLNNVRNVSLANFSVPELMRVLENAEHQIKQLTAMINDLLNVSLITTGRMTLEIEKIDLVDITKEVIESFSEVLKHEQYKIQVESKGPVIGYWDRARIEQAIVNLVSNAIKYGKKKPIDIKIFSNGNLGKFIIRDRGDGIARKEQKHLFGLFRRSSDHDKSKKGLGVGLYITNQIVKSHGGRIKIASRLQNGSTFIVELPLRVTTHKA